MHKGCKLGSAKWLLSLAGCICMLAVSTVSGWQSKKDSSGTTVNVNSANFYGVKTDSGEYNIYVGNVRFTQGTDTLYSDSAYQNTTTKNFEAFGNVKIAQAKGTQATSDYLKYTSAQKLAYMRGNVNLVDSNNRLWCDELTYDVGTKLGHYTNNGTLQSDSTVVSSKEGTYNGNSKDARFLGDVLVTDPQYKVRSEDLGYNTETKLVTFFPPKMSVVTSDKFILYTNNGTYDGKNEIAYLVSHSYMYNDDQYLEADTIYYAKLTGYGYANSHVVSIDTSHHSTLYCGHAEYFRNSRKLWATIKPVLKQVNDTDSLFIRADTFFSAPMPKPGDSIKIQKMPSTLTAQAPVTTSVKTGKKEKQPILPTATADTTTVDSSEPRYYIGFHHVKIFSDSLQGVCDSISFTQSDSTIRMMYSPIAWSRKSQITGDTILLHLDSNKIKDIYVPNNALAVSLSGPPKSEMYDQVQGKTLTGYFKNNEIRKLVVVPNAECIYYTSDNDGYLGVDEGKSEKMVAIFNDNKLEHIYFYRNPQHTLTPIGQADIPNLRLSRFKWLSDKRPKSKAELFE